MKYIDLQLVEFDDQNEVKNLQGFRGGMEKDKQRASSYFLKHFGGDAGEVVTTLEAHLKKLDLEHLGLEEFKAELQNFQDNFSEIKQK